MTAIRHAALGFASAVTLGLVPFALAAQQAPTPTVTVVTATAQDHVVTTRLPGRIKASTVAEVRPQVSGIIRERLFTEGGLVEEGQPLYKIEDETYVAAVAAAKAAVAQAQATYSQAEREARRAEELYATKTGSQQNRDNTISVREAANAALQLAQAQLLGSEIDLDRTTIRAPVSGVIGLSQSTTGALVSAGQAAALATIRTLDPVYVDVTQSANDLLRWQAAGGKASSGSLPDTEATMILPTGVTYGEKGALTAAEPQVEPTTGMITLRISFPNPDHILLPGLYVEVDLPQATQKGAYLIPQNAVMRDASGQAAVWVVEDGKVAARSVTTLGVAGNAWIIGDGLSGGEQVVTSGFQKATPGTTVEIAPAAPAEGN